MDAHFPVWGTFGSVRLSAEVFGSHAAFGEASGGLHCQWPISPHSARTEPMNAARYRQPEMQLERGEVGAWDQDAEKRCDEWTSTRPAVHRARQHKSNIASWSICFGDLKHDAFAET